MHVLPGIDHVWYEPACNCLIAACVLAEGPATACTSYSGHLPQTCTHVQVEVSLQPWRAFRPDGVILFSDILTPLTGMNIPFDITAGQGPIIADPIRTMEVRAATTRH